MLEGQRRSRYDDEHYRDEWESRPECSWKLVTEALVAAMGNLAMMLTKMPDWIVDTGAAYHMQRLSTADPACIRIAMVPRTVRSANGVFTMHKEAVTRVPSLGSVGLDQVMHLWKDTPNALSVGRLVLKDGCSFEWYPGTRPKLTLPDGTVVWMKIRKYVPFLPH